MDTASPPARITPCPGCSRAVRSLACLLGLAAVLLGAASAVAQYPPTKPTSPLLQPPKAQEIRPVEARLFTGHDAIRPGMQFQVAVHLSIKPGWHIFWRNPGDLPTGATMVKLRAPIGFAVGEALWSGPAARLTPAGLAQYVYEREATIVFPITAPKDWEAGDEVRIEAEYEWTAEGQTTARGKDTLELLLPVVGRDEPIAESPDLTKLLNALADMPADPEELDFTLETTWNGNELLISAPNADLLTFFPHASTDWALENAAKCIEGREKHLRAVIRDLRLGSKKPVTGVIAVGKRVDRRVTWMYYTLKAERKTTDL
jgi:DsbC/DsbD-like thiol-disulfide interchange protein